MIFLRLNIFLLLSLCWIADAQGQTVEDDQSNSAETECPSDRDYGTPRQYLAWTQSDVDEFAEKYPNCESLDMLRIEGDYYFPFLENRDPIVSLAGFQNLHSIDRLRVWDTSVESLADLKSLSRVRDFHLFGNDVLVAIDTPQKLEGITSITVDSNPLLPKIDPFFVQPAPNSRFFVVDIRLNPALEDCAAIAPFLGYPDRTPYQTLRYGWIVRDNAEGCMNAAEVLSSPSLPAAYEASYSEPIKCQEPDFFSGRPTLLSTQKDVDSFSDVYGECNVSEPLWISGTDIVNLDGLASLQFIESIQLDTPNLRDISGLQNLIWTIEISPRQRNGSDIGASLNESFANVKDPSFTSLMMYGTDYVLPTGGFSVPSGYKFFDSELFPNVKYVDSVALGDGAENSKIEEFCDVSINNTNLTDLSFLAGASMPCLASGMSRGRTPKILLRRNDVLTDTSALQTVTALQGFEFIVEENKQLTELFSPSVPEQSTLTALKLWYNGNLRSVHNFDNFETAIWLEIFDEPDLSTDSILSSVKSIENLWLRATAPNAGWFPSLEQVTNFALESAGFSGVSRIKSISGVLSISEPLEDLSGFNQVTDISALGVSNSNLSNLDFLSSIQRIASVNLMHNDNLKDVSSLENVTFFQEWEIGFICQLCVVDNPKLESLPLAKWYMSLLQEEDALYYESSIRSNPSLKKLEVFEQASYVGHLEISNNDSLTNLDSLMKVQSAQSLRLTDNQSLSDCKGLAPLLGWPNGPPEDGVEGEILISNNAEGCNAVEETFSDYAAELPTIRFLSLIDTVQTLISSNEQDPSAQRHLPASRAGEEAGAEGLVNEPIPTLSTLGFLILSALITLLGIRRLKAAV